MSFSGGYLFCDYGTPSHECAVHPVKIAELILSRRRRESEIQKIGIYRGCLDDSPCEQGIDVALAVGYRR